MIVTELENFYNMTAANRQIFVTLVKAQNIPLIILKLNAWDDIANNRTVSNGVAPAIAMADALRAEGIDTAIDLHTWYKTWDRYFRDTPSAGSRRTLYLTFVRNTISAFDGVQIAAFHVLNEPQARVATAGENQFIRDVIDAAKSRTNVPVGVRFMGGYSPTSGHYAADINGLVDLVCRNCCRWDARRPDVESWEVGETKLLASLEDARAAGKQFWMPEVGEYNTNPENQRALIASVIAWSKLHGVDCMSVYACQPSMSGETYDIMPNFVPLPAFYEITQDGVPPPPPNWANAMVDEAGGIFWNCERKEAWHQLPGASHEIKAKDYVAPLLYLQVLGLDGSTYEGTVDVEAETFTGWSVVAPPPECTVPNDCRIKHGDPAQGTHWICVDGVCWLENDPPVDCTVPNDCQTKYGNPDANKHWECQGGVCVQMQDKTGCFIATACGTSNGALTVLRRVRDRRMNLGVVKLYYRLSPPFASAISNRKALKRVPRMVFEWLAERLKDV